MIQKTVLVISSEEEIHQNINTMIPEREFSVITASNDQLSLLKTDQKLPDLIFCSLGDPEIDGYRFLTELRKSSNTFAIPFIFITSQFDVRQWRKGMALGADDFLFQPFTVSELHEVINTRLDKQEALANQYKQELEHLRKSIIDFLPHEMRTSLTGILASSDLLLNHLDQLDLSTVRELLNCIDSSTQRLSRLVHNFLLYSELSLINQNPDSIKLPSSPKTCSSAKTVECIATKLGKDRNRQIDINWQEEDIPLTIIPVHLTKLVEELIDNALKFSSVGTLIEVTGRQNGEYFHLSVRDSGRGMTARQIDLIGACVQFDRSTYEQQGCGLGLAIVKQIVQIYGGKLIINSIVNQETRVNVYLPLANSSLFSMIQPQPKKERISKMVSVSR